MRSRIIVVSMLTFILVLILTACGSDSSPPPDGEEPAPDIQPVEDPILVVESERLVTDIIGDERALRAMISPDRRSRGLHKAAAATIRPLSYAYTLSRTPRRNAPHSPILSLDWLTN